MPINLRMAPVCVAGTCGHSPSVRRLRRNSLRCSVLCSHKTQTGCDTALQSVSAPGLRGPAPRPSDRATRRAPAHCWPGLGRERGAGGPGPGRTGQGSSSPPHTLALLQAPSSLPEASRPLPAPRPARPSLRAWTRLQTSVTSVPASKVMCRCSASPRCRAARGSVRSSVLGPCPLAGLRCPRRALTSAAETQATATAGAAGLPCRRLLPSWRHCRPALGPGPVGIAGVCGCLGAGTQRGARHLSLESPGTDPAP